MSEYFKLKPAPSGSPKKWTVRVPTSSGRGKTVSFGARGYQDYTQHKDKKRRTNYRSRHRNDKLDDPTKAGFWSWYVLWGDTTDRNKAFASAVSRAKRLLPKKNPDVGLTPAGHWGNAASGILFVTPQKSMLLLRRSDDVLHPGTWGIPGGAIPEVDGAFESSSFENALNEASEELGIGVVPHFKLLGSAVMQDENSDFTYETFVGLVKRGFEPRLNWEHDDWGWFSVDEARHLDLHPGFRDLLDSIDPWNL